METFLAEKIINFYIKLGPLKLPDTIRLLNPQSDPVAMQAAASFFKKFYSDLNPRQLLFGINPGRFGAGTTGINFTAPRQLKNYLQIDHPFKDQSELSAEFIYEVIDRYGGAEKFYSDFFLTSVSPLGFTKNGKNLNYYDDKDLLEAVQPFVITSIKEQLRMFRPDGSCICIGGEKNYSFFRLINDKHRFFEKIIPLAHPRFIMQYRRKQKENFILEYLSALNELKT